MTQSPAHGPLAGLRIVEFSAFVAAPSAGLALAQLGAEVIRVDPPGGNIDAKRLPLNDGRCACGWFGGRVGNTTTPKSPKTGF